MQIVEIQLKALRILCDITSDRLRRIAPRHELLVYSDLSLPKSEKERLLLQFFIDYGPRNMNWTKPSNDDRVICFTNYRFALLAALAIEKARH
jgi:hypothetical protein